MKIAFLPLMESHFPLLLAWLERPHIKAWWDGDVIYTMDLIREKFSGRNHGLAISRDSNNRVYAYIITVDKEKIGYIQVYNARDFAQENGIDLGPLASSACGLDLFIGDQNYLHKGFGPLILYELENQILYPHFDWCLVDPFKSNKSAIRIFEKSGFKITPQYNSQDTIWMIKRLFPTSFSFDIDPTFDDKTAKALRRACNNLADIKTDFERVSIYLKHNHETVAGTICYIHGKILWCDSIYVDEDLQSKGLGSQLINKLFELAQNRQLHELQLNTYFPKAMQFFKKCGFEEVAVVPNWKYGLTCYLMRKRIK